MTAGTPRKPLPSPDEIQRLPADGGPDFNRLIHATSPYLLQHAANPVDWYPWGDEAFARAKKEDKPVFLSVGYSSCHWCHVMEHESFENDDVAALLNRHFVCIKVDREERPDIDEIYMTATQLLTGRGGWPNSVWLMPDGRPWFAGTYFPREDSYGRAGFKTLLTKLAEFWTTRRQDVESQADQMSAAIRQAADALTGGDGTLSSGWLRNVAAGAIEDLRRNYDLAHGGFGNAPKFPPHSALAFLLEEYQWNRDASILALVTGTLDAMARGGIHDHLGGGFHRYATDEGWLVPHFEKMLYDNAQLAAVYAEAHRVTGNAAYAAVARDTCDWVLREMTGPEGGFFSALDADSEGVEGRFYVWSHDEIVRILGEEDGALFCGAYNIRPGGNYRDEASGEASGQNIPHLTAWPPAEHADRLAAARAKLLAQRVTRTWPGLDDKVIASWNGLMIGALARAGTALQEPRYIEAATRAAAFILSGMTDQSGLLRTWRHGKAAVPAYLDDHVFLASGLLDLHDATRDERWKNEAFALLGIVRARFRDPRGGFFYNSDGHESLLTRTRDPFDQAVPSANAAAALLLLRAYDLTQDGACLDDAQASVSSVSRLIVRAPTGAGTYMIAAVRLADRLGEDAKPKPASARIQRGPVIVAGAYTSSNEVEVTLTIDKGWHINGHQPAEGHLVPTSVSGLTGVTYPPSPVYTDKVLLRGRRKGDDPVSVTFQPCDDARCLKTETVTLDLPPD
jgi:uncharacterized protein YyaL (SSP411 family)